MTDELKRRNNDTEENTQINPNDSSHTFNLDLEQNYKFAKEICSILIEIISENEQNNIKPTEDSFYRLKIPSMSLEDYINRIIKYSLIEPSTLILSIIYIDELCDNKNYILSFNNIHRIVLTSIVCSIKYNEDDYFKNNQYAKIGGISLKEMNKLEYEFSCLLDFSYFVETEKFEKYQKFLMANTKNRI